MKFHAAFLLMLVLEALPAQTLLAQSSSKFVKITLSDITCIQPTSNDDRDEIYILSSVPNSSGAVRLPQNADNNDYLELTRGHSTKINGWTGRGQDARETPVLWQGNLCENDTKTIIVQFHEQDNEELNTLLNFLGNAAKAIDTINNYIDLDSTLSNFAEAYNNHYKKEDFPAKHAYFGGFAVSVQLKGQALKLAWAPLNSLVLKEKQGNTAVFESIGEQQSHYKFSAEAQLVEEEEIVNLFYLGDESDGCGGDQFFAVGKNNIEISKRFNALRTNPALLRMAFTKQMFIMLYFQEVSRTGVSDVEMNIDGDGYWYWICGNMIHRSRGRTEFRERVNHLKIRLDGRSIKWACYNSSRQKIKKPCK